MTYRVELTARDLNGLEKAIYTLEAYPLRCAAAPESKKAPSLRQETAHLPRQVLTIRHGAMEAADLNG